MAKEKAKAETAVAVQDKQPDAMMARPAFIPTSQEGFESMDSQDLILPRLQICQALSPQREEGNPRYIQDLREGDFFNSVTGEIYGPGPFKVTPILLTKSRLKFNPNREIQGAECIGTPCQRSRSNPEGIACRLNDGGPCLNPGFEKESCKLVYNYPVYIHGLAPAPVVFSFKSMGVKVAKGWNSMMKMRGGGAAMYAMVFSVTSVVMKSPKGTFRQAKIENAGWVTDEKLYGAMQDMYNSVKDRVILTDPEDDAGDAIESEATEAGDTSFNAGE